MAHIIFPKQWTQKPPNDPCIDWGHPLAAGLEACWLFTGTLGGLNDLTGHRPPGTLTTATWGNNRYGVGLNFPGTSGQKAVLQSTGPILGGRTNWSIHARATTSASSIASGRALYTERASSGNDLIQIQACANGVGSGNKSIFYYRNDAGTLGQVVGSVVTNNGSAYTHTATKAGTAMTLYLEEVVDGSVTFGSGSDAFTNSGIECHAGSDKADSNNVWDGGVNYVYLWSRALSRDQIGWLVYEPFAFMVQQARARYFISTANQAGRNQVIIIG